MVEYLYNLDKYSRDVFYKKYDMVCKYCDELEINQVNELISRRAFDKSLMMMGGFKKENLEAFKEEIVNINC